MLIDIGYEAVVRVCCPHLQYTHLETFNHLQDSIHGRRGLVLHHSMMMVVMTMTVVVVMSCMRSVVGE